MELQELRSLRGAISQLVGLRMVFSCGMEGLENALEGEFRQIGLMTPDSEILSYSELEEQRQRYWDYYESQKNSLRLSLVIMGFSTFEWVLRYVAVEQLKRIPTKFEFKDFNGSGIEGARTVLKNYCQYANVLFGARWERTIAYRSVRNAFVHRMGVFEADEDSAEIEAILSKLGNARISRDRYSDLSHVWLEDEFIWEMLLHFEEQIYDLEEIMLHGGAVKCP